MRAAFVQTLIELAESDSRILLLTGDLGFMALEPFAEKFPDRFFNVGVAEQNMIGLATGMAEADYVPYVYSIVTFATLRPYEFIRNGPILHRQRVRIVGMGGGFEYGSAGFTHHGLEDIGVMRVQPGISVIAPADYQQARAALWATRYLPGPVYYRLGKDDRTVVPGLEGRFVLGRAELIRQGSDALIVATGSVSSEAAAAAQTLADLGIGCAVMVVASISPPPVADLVNTLSAFEAVFTVEAHYSVGGLGSLVSEVIAAHGLACRVIPCSVKEVSNGLSGGQAYLYHRHALSSEALVATVIRELEAGHPPTRAPRRPVVSSSGVEAR